jgi:hypothetical protein
LGSLFILLLIYSTFSKTNDVNISIIKKLFTDDTSKIKKYFDKSLLNQIPEQKQIEYFSNYKQILGSYKNTIINREGFVY